MCRTDRGWALDCITQQPELFSTLHKNRGVSVSRDGNNKGFFAQYPFPSKTHTVLFSATSDIYNAHKTRRYSFTGASQTTEKQLLPQGMSILHHGPPSHPQTRFWHNGIAKHWPAKLTPAPPLKMNTNPPSFCNSLRNSKMTLSRRQHWQLDLHSRASCPHCSSTRSTKHNTLLRAVTSLSSIIQLPIFWDSS